MRRSVQASAGRASLQRASWAVLLLGFYALPLFGQLSTEDHLAEPGFWPTAKGSARSEYVGSTACAECHAAKVAAQGKTAMAQTSMPADTSEILHSHPEMHFAVGRYRYDIKTAASGSLYSVTDGTRALTATLRWAFGNGRVGQSYLFKKPDGRFYEARVTYFDSLAGLNFTPDRALLAPKDLPEAMERPVDAEEIGRCFGCHTTASTDGDRFDEKNLMLGVSCEACHGAGGKHARAEQLAAANTDEPLAQSDIFNPERLLPADSGDFCGACHGTWWDVKFSRAKGVTTAKSQPYRLEGSKCWGKGDRRLTCVSCHDPHVPLQTNPVAYDQSCLACHVMQGERKTESRPGAACPVSRDKCVSCHMPKVYVPEMHYNFTDHRIRIARAGDPYPE